MHVNDITQAAGYNDTLRMLRRRLQKLETNSEHLGGVSNRRFASARGQIIDIRSAVMALETDIDRLECREERLIRAASESIEIAREALELVHDAHATRSLLGISPPRRQFAFEHNGPKNGSNGLDEIGALNGSNIATINSCGNEADAEDVNGSENGSNVADGSGDGDASGSACKDGGDGRIVLMEVRRTRKRPYSRFLDLMALEADQESDLEQLGKAEE